MLQLNSPCQWPGATLAVELTDCFGAVRCLCRVCQQKLQCPSAASCLTTNLSQVHVHWLIVTSSAPRDSLELKQILALQRPVCLLRVDNLN